MNQPCYRCGRVLEEGKVFCPECGAPQIRVTLPDPAPQPAMAGDEGILQSHAESTRVLPGDGIAGASSQDVKACALAAVLSIFLTFLGLNPFVGALAAGWLAVVFSRRRTVGGALRPGFGARLGATAGLILFGLSTIFETLAVVLAHRGSELRAEMLDKVRQLSERYPTAEVQPFLEFVRTPEGFAIMMVGSVIFGLIAFTGLSAAAGALCAVVLGKRRS